MAARVWLLGPPAIAFGGERMWPQAGKTSALLLYLAYRGDWVSRVEIADLFWRESNERTARTNLRSLLSRTVSTRAYARALETEPTRVRWRVPTDVAEFERAVASNRPAKAFGSYGGDLLEGFLIEGSQGFDEWLGRERERLRDSWRTCGLDVSSQLEAGGEWPKSAEVLDRLLKADPYDEAVLRRLLVALSSAGQPERAREVYDRFAAWLEEEVGAQPEPETTSALTEGGTGGKGIAAFQGPATGAIARSRLPKPVSATVGRAAERAQVARLLQEGSRLVTLSGPGGIGKTRLAIAVAHDLDASEAGRAEDESGGPPASPWQGVGHHDFAGRVRFAACETVDDTDGLVAAIADAVGLPLIGPGQPRRQLLDFLAERRLLLVLDNLEQLSGHLDVLDEILEASPGISILTTSRALLGSRHEHVVDVGGLAMPPPGDELVASEVTGLPALDLFMSCARRVRPDFSLTDANVAAVTGICRMVDGMPLAIELATSWLRAVTPEEIAGEIARGLDILEAAVSTQGDRHRSVRAAFDYSWRVLPREEQRVLARLSVFGGSFDLPAASAVAGASVATMAALVNKSLLAQPRPGRYSLHPLVRSYAAEKLLNVDAAGAGTEETRLAHRAYYAAFLEERAGALGGGDQLRALDEIAAQIDDVRAAWDAALQEGDVVALDSLAPALTLFYTFRSRFHEMLAQYSTAARRLRDLRRTGTIDSLLSMLLTHVGWSSMRLGRYQEAEAALLEADAIAPEGALEPRYPAGDPRLPLSLMASIRGEFDLAAAYAEEALGSSLEHANTTNERIAHYALARAAIGTERFEAAEEHVRLALSSSERDGDRWFLGDCLLELGDVALGLGRPDEADREYVAGLEICVEFGNSSGVAEAMNRRAALALRSKDHDAAHRLYVESLAASEAVGDGREIARAECGLAAVLTARNEPRRAASHYRRALRHAAKLRSWPLVRNIADGASSVVTSGDLLSRTRWVDKRMPQPSELTAVIHDLDAALAGIR